MILSAIGIIMMVDVHAGSPIGFLINLFPYDSFFMPLFVFISGYFFNPEKATNMVSYIIGKLKRLLVPYVVHNLLIGGLVTILLSLFGITWFAAWSPGKFLRGMFSSGIVFDVTSASWFIIMLFMVTTIYLILEKIPKWGGDNLVSWKLFILCILNVVSVWISRNDWVSGGISLLLLKCAFFLVFYHLGRWYRIKVEVLNTPPQNLVLFCSILMLVLHLFYSNNDLIFIRLAFFVDFKTDNLMLPFISSVLGIGFYLGCSQFLEPLIGNNRIVNFISENTLVILTTHLVFFNLVNLFLYFCHNQFGLFPEFNSKIFSQSAWYLYLANPAMRWIYLSIGLVAPLCLLRTPLARFLKS